LPPKFAVNSRKTGFSTFETGSLQTAPRTTQFRMKPCLRILRADRPKWPLFAGFRPAGPLSAKGEPVRRENSFAVFLSASLRPKAVQIFDFAR
jgi:hypothetical protein